MIGFGWLEAQNDKRIADRANKHFDAEDFDWKKAKHDWAVKLRASSMPEWQLFDSPQAQLTDKIESGMDNVVVSKCGTWAYRNLTLPKGQFFNWYSNSGKVYTTHSGWSSSERRPESGVVVFDDDYVFPAIYESKNGGDSFNRSKPWMSLTPNEMITLRPGIRKSKGHTVIAGLGIGWMLAMVAERPKVKKITLVEISDSLVNWLWPKIEARLTDDQKAKVVIKVGDAKDVMPDLEADVGLIDIFPGMGYNHEDTHQWRERCPRIKDMWLWG